MLFKLFSKLLESRYDDTSFIFVPAISADGVYCGNYRADAGCGDRNRLYEPVNASGPNIAVLSLI